MPQVRTSTKALIRHQGKYLVLKEKLPSSDEVWDLPGGKIEYGESPEEALLREVKEELDLTVEVIKPVGMYYFFTQGEKDQIICHVFLCEVLGDEIKIDTSKNPADEEFVDIRWLSLAEILTNQEISLGESFRKLIESLKNADA